MLGSLFTMRSQRNHAITAPWLSSTMLAFVPPTLVNPLEPGTNYDPAYPGRGVGIPAITGLFTRIDSDGVTVSELAGDGSQDLLIATPENSGGAGNGIPDGSASPRTGRMTIEDWRNVRVVGGDLTGAAGVAGLRLVASLPSCESIVIEGLRGDFSLAPETDAIGILGNTSGNRPDIYIMACHLRGMFGTNLIHDVGRPMSSISMSSGGVLTCVVSALTISSPTVSDPDATSTIAVGDEVIVAVGDPASAFASNWQVSAINTSTRTLTLANSRGVPLPANGTSASGTLYRLQAGVAGLHADGLQIYSIGRIGALYIDRCHFRGNYQPGVIIGGFGNGMGNVSATISRCLFEHQDHDPQDYGSISLFLGDRDNDSGTVAGRGARLANAMLYDVSVTGRTGRTLGQIVSPQTGFKVNGLSFGALIETVGGVTQAWWPNHPTARIKGVVKFGVPSTSPAPWTMPGLGVAGYGYISPGYYGRAATPSALPPIVINGTRSLAADAPRGSEMGTITLPGKEAGWIIDVTLIDDAGGRVQVIGNRLQRGRVASDPGTFSCTLRAKIRENPSITRDLTTTITITAPVATPIYASMTNAEAKAVVRAMYALPTSAQCADIDALFTALKAINGGAFYGKLKGLYFPAALSDRRDAGFNWVAPGAIDLHESNTPRSWNARQGYAGSSTNKFTLADSTWTLDGLGLTQNAASVMVGYALKNPDTADGALSGGTDYIIGNDKFFVACTTSGAIIAQCNNSSARTTSSTPLSGVGGAVQVIAMTRQSSTGFDLMHGSLSSALSAPLAITAGTTQASVSVTPSTYAMVASGRNAAGTLNYCTKTLPFFAVGTGWTTSEAEALRSTLASFATASLGLS